MLDKTHTKGAFTGALKDRPGLLRTADGGVLFLDEIGELGSDEQAMLLRALEEKTFLPLGSDRESHSDFQLIAGTNRDLFAAVREGRFREDLLSRINLWTFSLPGLRTRPEDIEPNLQFELDQYAQKTGNHITFSKEARQRFIEFALSPGAAWKGNFRELNAAVVRMATLALGGRISVEIVDEEIERLNHSWADPRTGDSENRLRDLIGGDRWADMDAFDRVQVAHVIEVCRQCRSLSEAGRLLFSASRGRKASRTMPIACVNTCIVLESSGRRFWRVAGTELSAPLHSGSSAAARCFGSAPCYAAIREAAAECHAYSGFRATSSRVSESASWRHSSRIQSGSRFRAIKCSTQDSRHIEQGPLS